MPSRHLPVHPSLGRLATEAAALRRAVDQGDPAAIAELQANHPGPIAPHRAGLADAQLALARSYGVSNWPRLVAACELIDAIWRDDPERVRAILSDEPAFLHEMARGTAQCNWGPPMSYAANLGRDRLVQLLHQLGAQDVMHALSRAILQSRIPTARLLYEIAGRPPLPLGEAMGPAESLSASGMALVIDLGGEIADESGDWRGPAALVLETYARNPEGKHAILELMAARGFPLPDTPPMAVHRGRIDLLEDQVRRDPGLLNRTFSHEEIYPPAIGCHADHSLALHGTPLAGGALLHLCVDGDELAMARWLLQHGSDVNAKAEIDRDGFGGHTPLFGCVVSQPYRAGCRRDDAFARLLLEHGADPNVRASLRKRLRFVDDESEHQYRDVTPLSWGRRFHDQDWVNQAVVRLITEYGGRDREAGPGL